MTILSVAGNEEKLHYCRSLGADVVINYKEDDFVKRVKEETGGKGSITCYKFTWCYKDSPGIC